MLKCKHCGDEIGEVKGYRLHCAKCIRGSTTKCVRCNKKFVRKHSGQICCSQSCSRKGITHTKEARRKISKAFRGRTSPMKGRKHTQETKDKIRATLLERYYGLKKDDQNHT